MKKVYLVVLILLFIYGIFYLLSKKPAPTYTNQGDISVVVGQTAVIAEVADTPEERQQGLSGRKELAEGRGMLFIFDTSDYHGFWMPDMHFAIDIIWIDDSFQVVHIKKNVSPESYPTVFEPAQPAQYVLEVPAGFAEAQHIAIADHVTLKKIVK